MEAPKTLIEQDRITQVTEVGIIDGGKWADVLAVSYGPGDTTVRLRFEETGKRSSYEVPLGTSLDEALNKMADVLFLVFPYEQRPFVTSYRGHQARKWVKRFIAQADRAAQAVEEGRIEPKVGPDGLARVSLTIHYQTEPSYMKN